MQEQLAVVAARMAMTDRVLEVLSPRSERTGGTRPPEAPGVDFASVLASLLQSSGPPVATRPVAVAAPPVETPAGLNGRLSPHALAPIGVGHHRLQPAAAEAFGRMRQAAIVDGVDFGVSDSYRDIGRQHELAESLGLYSEGGLAAVPGTSNHGWGLSLDLDLDGEALAWMRANAHRFDFVEDVPREPWHWTYHP